MTDVELQDEEREVLLSIYEGDENFKQLGPNVFQYKYGKNDNSKSFLLEIRWGERYPSQKPIVSMDAFYNDHVVKPLKEKIVDVVLTEAEQYLGMCMTYSLFEFLKEKFEELIEEQPEEPVICVEEKEKLLDDVEEAAKKPQKKEQLTKAQKRRQWDRVDGKGEKPRGWDWVDIVKHLSQTGSKNDATCTS